MNDVCGDYSLTLVDGSSLFSFLFGEIDVKDILAVIDTLVVMGNQTAFEHRFVAIQ